MASETNNLYIFRIQSILFSSRFWYYMVEVMGLHFFYRFSAILTTMRSLTPYFFEKFHLWISIFESLLFFLRYFRYRLWLFVSFWLYTELQRFFPARVWEWATLLWYHLLVSWEVYRQKRVQQSFIMPYKLRIIREHTTLVFLRRLPLSPW